MPAIARFDEPYAQLLRGFVEQGLPDGTRARHSAGDLSVDQLLRQQSGILLRFPAHAASMDDGWNYSVKVLPGKGDRVAVRCAETLFRHVWDRATSPELQPQPGEPPVDLAAIIVATVTEHNRAFGEWVDGGGEVTRIERAELPDDPADALHPDFQRWLADLYRQGKSLSDGPANGWWSAPGDRRSIGAGITTGSGADPFYRLGPDAGEALDSAHLEHLESLKTAGTAAWIVAALMMLIACGGISFHGWQGWEAFQGYSLGAIPYYMLADTFGGFVALLWIPLGQGLRAPSRRWLFRRGPAAARYVMIGLAVIGMLPCAGPCCLAGFPVGGWIIYLLVDERAKRLLKN